MLTGRIEIEAVALDAIHHGAGVSGNTQRLRTQTVVLDDGSVAQVPFVSGSSFKHLLREGMVRHALAVMEVEDGSMNKAQVDLLFSGGHLSKGGASVDLSSARELESLFPALAVCGYSAGNTMRAAKISVDNFHVVCAENKWRVPGYLADGPHVQKRIGAFRDEEFGTRHEASKYEFASRLLPTKDRLSLEGRIGKNRTKKTSETDKGDSSQMIFEFQTLVAGTRLFGGISFSELTTMEMAALKSGMSFACLGETDDGGYIFSLGAKSSVGVGRTLMRFRGAMKAITVQTQTSKELSTVGVDQDYEGHLRENRDAILDALKRAVE